MDGLTPEEVWSQHFELCYEADRVLAGTIETLPSGIPLYILKVGQALNQSEINAQLISYLKRRF